MTIQIQSKDNQPFSLTQKKVKLFIESLFLFLLNPQLVLVKNLKFANFQKTCMPEIDIKRHINMMMHQL